MLGYALYGNRDQFLQASFSLDYAQLGISLALWVGSYLLFAQGWSLVLRAIGSPVNWWGASRVWFLSQGLKYVPGSVVYAFGRVYLAQEQGVRAAPAALGLALENLLPLATALLVFLGLLPFGMGQGLPSSFSVLSVVALAALVFTLPLLLGRLSAVWPALRNLSLDYRSLALLLGYYFLVWLVVGLACYFSFRALGGGYAPGFLQVLGLYPLTWAAGLVAVFAPGGVGVRDGMLILLMSSFIPLPAAALGAAMVRVQTLAVEGLLALLALKAWPR